MKCVPNIHDIGIIVDCDADAQMFTNIYNKTVSKQALLTIFSVYSAHL